MSKNKNKVNEVNDTLVNLESAWSESEPKVFASIPDGDYLGKLVNMEIGFSKNNRLQVVSEFEIADGKYKGKTLKKFDGLKDEVNMSFFKGYCEVLGIDIPDNISDLPDVLSNFTDDFNSLVNIVVKTKDEYTNIYVKGISDYVDEDGTAGEAEEEEEEEKEEEEKVDESKHKSSKSSGKSKR